MFRMLLVSFAERFGNSGEHPRDYIPTRAGRLSPLGWAE
jgi:hypothetical protein